MNLFKGISPIKRIQEKGYGTSRIYSVQSKAEVIWAF